MLEGIDYVPLLHTKRAEVRALSKLDDSVKQQIFPLLMVRYGGHHNLEDTWDKLRKIVSGMQFGIGVDESAFNQCKNEPAKTQFDALFEPAEGYKNFFQFVASFENAVPIFQCFADTYSQIAAQIEHVNSLGRGAILRIQRQTNSNWQDILHSDGFQRETTLFVVDAGWALDVLQMEQWSSEIIRQITDYYPEAEIVAMSSCFPNSFGDIGAKGVISIDDRELFARLVRQHNAAKLNYGDWGSTRKAVARGGSGEPWPRIDVASVGDWTCFRRTDEEEGYRPVAARTIADDYWQQIPDAWGKYMIDRTAQDLPVRIRNAEMATSARINLHLTVQGLENAEEPVPDEPFTDDF